MEMSDVIMVMSDVIMVMSDSEVGLSKLRWEVEEW